MMSKLNENTIKLTRTVKYLQEENRCLREKLYQVLEIPQEVQVEEPVYEPQTYDEAIALCKDWRRCVVDDFVHWETPRKDIWRVSVLDRFSLHLASWENNRWPELWKEMVKDRYPGHLGFCEDEWIFKALIRHRDSTPGRVVCQAYLYYRNHRNWAERLSKTEDDCD